MLLYIRCKEIGWKGLDCIDLTRDKGNCQAFVKTITMLCCLYNAGKFLTA
jgi:hypothetical protein